MTDGKMLTRFTVKEGKPQVSSTQRACALMVMFDRVGVPDEMDVIDRH
jgi:hypothetical protein